MRRFNYTNRERITSDHFSARVTNAEPLTASVHLQLSGLSLPPEASIGVEPYSGTISKRIPCGTVATPAVPSTIDLEDLRTGASIQFRVKVVTSDGKLVAAANRMRLIGVDEETGRKALLPVETTPDLGEEIWRLEVDESTAPKLLLNSRIPAIERRLVADPVLAGAILLPAVRAVVEVLAESLDGDVWQPDWLTFVRRWEPGLHPEKILDEEDRERLAWTVVEGFSRDQGFVRLVLKSQEEA